MLEQDHIPLPTPTTTRTSFVPDDSIDNIELDPELARIAALVSARQQSEGPIHSRGVSPALEGGPETVSIKVRWKYHPKNQSGDGKPQAWGFKVKRVRLLVLSMVHGPYVKLFLMRMFFLA